MLSSDGRAPAIIDSIIVEASVDIYPDKYLYTKGSEGTVNLVVDIMLFQTDLLLLFKNTITS
ncbi:hypothetical protein [Methanosarcina sp. UBA289]|uniref:hypothetical protein n=1 Tax=Methanosarcina sp. UBA289 TaxID=1915574 RepID=UPI0025F3F225|nr:hypothetical protein [Methanosarcina sp. UBA289]